MTQDQGSRAGPLLARLGFPFWKTANTFCGTGQKWSRPCGIHSTLRNMWPPPDFFVGCMRRELPKLGPGCHYPSKRLGYNVEFRMHRQFEPKFAAIALNNKNCPPIQRLGNKKDKMPALEGASKKVQLILLNKSPSSILQFQAINFKKIFWWQWNGLFEIKRWTQFCSKLRRTISGLMDCLYLLDAQAIRCQTKTFWNKNNYNLQFRQTQFAIWTKTFKI